MTSSSCAHITANNHVQRYSNIASIACKQLQTTQQGQGQELTDKFFSSASELPLGHFCLWVLNLAKLAIFPIFAKNRTHEYKFFNSIK